jgi:glycine cleavage system pyridoxal-binding protein P
MSTTSADLPAFAGRHIGPRDEDIATMLSVVGRTSLDDLLDAAVPDGIRALEALDIEPAASEAAVVAELREVAARNRRVTSMIGLGYYGTHTPAVIARNVLENPAWYTAYTPYQPEISQGRLEALLNFADLLALTLLTPPGEWGADIAVGTPSASACRWASAARTPPTWPAATAFKRSMPGPPGRRRRSTPWASPAYRLALQTREQHIRREKATSNICTAQVLLAVMASMYAVYHGPRACERIARGVHAHRRGPRRGPTAGRRGGRGAFFDTLRVHVPGRARAVVARRWQPASTCAASTPTPSAQLDETTGRADLCTCGQGLRRAAPEQVALDAATRSGVGPGPPAPHQRLPHPPGVQHPPQRDEMLRYLRACPTRTWRWTAG